MEKGAINKKGLILGVLLTAFIAVTTLYTIVINRSTATPVKLPVKPVIRQEVQLSNFNYQGETGKDALTLLKQKAVIEQDKSGLVIAINGRRVDNSKHEYWAFYANGKLADVGPKDYITKNTDQIIWKIEKY